MPAAFLRLLAGALMLALLLPAAEAAPPAPAVAARIDGAPLYGFSVDAAWRMALAEDPGAQRKAVLDKLVDDRLLARAARERYGEAALTSGARVAFPREVGFDEQLVGALRMLYGARMEADLSRLAGGIDAMLRPLARPDDAALDGVTGKAGMLRLETAFSAGQLEAARKLALLRYVLPDGGAEATVTVADIYLRQNVQGRVAILARDVDFMLQQARQHVAAQYVLHWSRQRFGAAAVDDLRRVLADQSDARALMRMHGVGDDGHGDSALLDRLAAQVGKDAVRAYYREHRDQFTRIERVRARHIRLPDEESAHKAAAALAAGADFAATARRLSVAPDAARGGALGWVPHDSAPGWLAQLLFAQAEGAVSPPVRTAVGPDQPAAWEIVLVEQRVQGYQAADSESVRYVASRALARQAAAAQLADLRRTLLARARVVIVPGGQA